MRAAVARAEAAVGTTVALQWTIDGQLRIIERVGAVVDAHGRRKRIEAQHTRAVFEELCAIVGWMPGLGVWRRPPLCTRDRMARIRLAAHLASGHAEQALEFSVSRPD